MDEAELAIMERMSTSPWVHKLVKEVRRLQGNIMKLHGIEQAWEEYADELDNLLDEGCLVVEDVLRDGASTLPSKEFRKLWEWTDKVEEFYAEGVKDGSD